MGLKGTGFGHYKFGQFPFGRSDFGEDTVVRSYPASYVTDTNGQTNQLLKVYLETIKNSVNSAKQLIDNLDNQLDPNTVRSDILSYLGQTINAHIDNYEPREFQRSLVANAIQFYRIKGTRDAYRVRGKISGYDVEVINIYRIVPSALLETVTAWVIPAVTGTGTLNQTLAGKLPTFPVNPSSITFRSSGVAFATDNGSGRLVAAGGSSFAVSNSTIDYGAGLFSFTVTPGLPSGANLSVDLTTDVAKLSLGSPTGAASQTFARNLPFYPIFPDSLTITVDGVAVARDDGSGSVVAEGASSYGVSGTVDMNALSVTLTPSPPLGAIVNASFKKSLLSEMLQIYPDDIYEIPSGSGRWYSTIVPGGIAGGPQDQGCGYCLTSFIKVRFTLVKASNIQIPSSTENFFDRLVRKLKDITPAHVRDIIYELRFTVSIDENENLGALRSAQEENTWMPLHAFYRFDSVPADSAPLDKNGFVTGTVSLE